MAVGVFSDALTIKQVGYHDWEVVVPFTFTSVTGLLVVVEAGFITDLASVPAQAKVIVDTPSYWSQAAVVHDRLYFEHRTGYNTIITRNQADLILVECMKANAISFDVPREDQRHISVYGAVSLFALPSWETPEEKEARIKRNSLPDEVIA